MAWFGAQRGVVALCMRCLLDWFPGRSAAWLEERLDEFIDHIDYRLAVAQAREAHEPPPDKKQWRSNRAQQSAGSGGARRPGRTTKGVRR